MTDWSDNYVLIDTNNDDGRSITGHATESLVVGRALLCGYNIFILQPFLVENMTLF